MKLFFIEYSRFAKMKRNEVCGTLARGANQATNVPKAMLACKEPFESSGFSAA